MQKQRADEYWLITQPAHAALAGDLAAALRDDVFGPLDAAVCRSIALHDSGWSMHDAAQIQTLRAHPKQRPESFLEPPVEEVVQAWTASIDCCEKFAPIGGYLVSRHFERLSRRDQPKSCAQFEKFQKREQQRQSRLRAGIRADAKSLERMVDALQFCDVLSLYLCCGSTQAVRIKDQQITISRSGEGYKIEPSPFKSPMQVSFSALRHPAASGRKSKSGATFYVNL
jgi:hypothetical protein